jgi:hypothetical protein
LPSRFAAGLPWSARRCRASTGCHRGFGNLWGAYHGTAFSPRWRFGLVCGSIQPPLGSGAGFVVVRTRMSQQNAFVADGAVGACDEFSLSPTSLCEGRTRICRTKADASQLEFMRRIWGVTVCCDVSSGVDHRLPNVFTPHPNSLSGGERERGVDCPSCRAVHSGRLKTCPAGEGARRAGHLFPEVIQ